MPRLKLFLAIVQVSSGVLFGAVARADERVLLLVADSGAATSGLQNALSVQLLGAAELATAPLPPATGAVSERIAGARNLARERHALLAVWAEGPNALPDGSKEAVLYAVGERDGRALLEVVRIPGGQGPDMDRTLALKVREMVDELVRARETSPGSGLLDARAAASEPRSPLGFSADLALVGQPRQGTSFGQWGGAVAVGPLLLLDAARIALLGELRWLPPLTIERPDARVRLGELAPFLMLHGQMRVTALWLGARSGFGLAFAHADATTAGGARGGRTESRFAFRMGLDAEAPLGTHLGLVLGLELELDLRRQRFAVNDREVLDLGRLVPVLSLGLRYASE